MSGCPRCRHRRRRLQRRPVRPRAAGRCTHVLYLDDDEVMGLMVERLLAREGHQVTVFRDPAQAVAAVQAAPHRFGIVVSDYNMPQLSGLDVAQRVRAVRPALPVLITSGYVSDELEARARAIGINALLQKQNTLEELPAAVQSALRRPATARRCSAAASALRRRPGARAARLPVPGRPAWRGRAGAGSRPSW